MSRRSAQRGGKDAAGKFTLDNPAN